MTINIIHRLEKLIIIIIIIKQTGETDSMILHHFTWRVKKTPPMMSNTRQKVRSVASPVGKSNFLASVSVFAGQTLADECSGAIEFAFQDAAQTRPTGCSPLRLRTGTRSAQLRRASSVAARSATERAGREPAQVSIVITT